MRVVSLTGLSLLLFAVTAQADEPAKDEMTYQGQGVTAWRKKLKDDDPKVRAQAAGALGLFGREAKPAVPDLIEALSDPDVTVHRQSVRALGAIGADPERTVPALLKALRERRSAPPAGVISDPLADLTPEVTAGMRHFGKDAVPGLVEGLRDPSLRDSVLRILGQLGAEAKPALPQVKDALKDESADVRISAAGALARIDPGDEAGLQVLLEILKDRKGAPGSRLCAALAAYGPKARKATPTLIEALKGKSDVTTKTAIVQALGSIGSDTPDIIPALREAGKEAGLAVQDALRHQGRHVVALFPEIKPSGFAVYQGDMLLVASGMGRDAVPPLVEVLKDAERPAEDKLKAIRILTTIGQRTDLVVPALARALEDKDREVQKAAATLLGYTGPAARDAIPALQEWRKKEGMADAATLALASIDLETPDILPKLLEWLPSGLPLPGGGIRPGSYDARGWQAQSLIERIGPERAKLLPALLAAWPKATPGARFLLARVFGKMGAAAKEAVPLLKELLKEKDEQLKMETALALARIEPRSKDAFDVLLPMLEDRPEDKTRVALQRGIQAMLDLGPAAAPAVVPLTRLLDHQLPGIADHALRALAKIGPGAREAAPAILQVLFEKGPAWAPTVIGALAAIGPDGEGVVDALIEHQAWGALEKMGPAARKAVPQLQKAIREGPNASAAIAYWRLEHKAGPVVPSLIATLGNNDVLEILADAGPAASGAVPALHRLLDSVYGDRRVSAAYALWRIDGKAERPIAVLTEALHDRSRYGLPTATEEAARAAVALGKMGPAAKAAVPSLLDACHCSLSNIRTAAREAVKAIDPEAAKKAGIE